MKAMQITLVILGSVMLLFGAAQHGARAVENTPTPTPTPLVPSLLDFTEYSSTDQLSFTVLTDGTAILQRLSPKDRQPAEVVWKQPGKITPAQLDTINALREPLSTAANQHSSGKNYAFVVRTADEKLHEVLFNPDSKASDPTPTALLQDAVAKLLEIRRPFETLVTFEWTGGFAARSTALTISNDGTATLENKIRQTSSSRQLSQEALGSLRMGLQSDSFARYEQPSGFACADCWIYTITAMTDNGLHKIQLTDADLASTSNPVPVEIQKLIESLKRLSSPA